MSFSIFPTPSTSGGSSVPAFAATLAAMSTTYENNQDFEPGVYTISVTPSTTDVRATFLSASALLTTQDTTSGTVAFNLTTLATKVIIFGKAGGTPGAVVKIEKTANALTPGDIGNGTLDTINTTGAYNETGVLGVLVYGGGQGGLRHPNNSANSGGTGGRAGFINGDVVVTTTATTVTVGAGGNGQSQNVAASTPGDSSFGNLVTATAASNFYPNGNGGGGGFYDNSGGGAGSTSGVFISWNSNDTTGGGGGGNAINQNANTPAGGGSGVGTGGAGGTSANIAPTAGTGKASGGGGAKGGNGNAANTGGLGAAGVVYILRGF
jgi:hypothetical protein